ncbi:hypothetical protein PPL_00695 [Heterostelium album PN500]|uniref:B box-type domain-containing protein n=1 Tax=Heterostelium pallidum (strain ATCC 26659 / Pp 5 / PN500) TaxID=670386 RepID=D3AX65_HETP5|nr:hypothetical protein PPL_00695 [Heterostelium album PN500]EFA86134.1 hypothetical protein PPL_00695 [Heterostelium album PN500]|eukprot:XP_020438239.1 hypothetical protein PPL_00695 [Heterostelium album PN500]
MTKCLIHQRSHEIICYQCNSLLCSQCYKDHSDHTDHVEHISDIKHAFSTLRLDDIKGDTTTTTNNDFNNVNNHGNIFHSQINDIWESLRSSTSRYQALSKTENEIKQFFEEMHQFLTIKEHKLQRDIINDKQTITKQIDKKIMNLKYLVNIINISNKLNNNDISNSELNNDICDDQSKITDTTTLYSTTTIMESITTSSSLQSFINHNNQTLFNEYLDLFDTDELLKQHTNDTSSLLLDIIHKYNNQFNESTTITDNNNLALSSYKLSIKQPDFNQLNSIIEQSIKLDKIESINTTTNNHNKQSYISTTHLQSDQQVNVDNADLDTGHITCKFTDHCNTIDDLLIALKNVDIVPLSYPLMLGPLAIIELESRLIYSVLQRDWPFDKILTDIKGTEIEIKPFDGDLPNWCVYLLPLKPIYDTSMLNTIIYFKHSKCVLHGDFCKVSMPTSDERDTLLDLKFISTDSNKYWVYDNSILRQIQSLRKEIPKVQFEFLMKIKSDLDSILARNQIVFQMIDDSQTLVFLSPNPMNSSLIEFNELIDSKYKLGQEEITCTKSKLVMDVIKDMFYGKQSTFHFTKLGNGVYEKSVIIYMYGPISEIDSISKEISKSSYQSFQLSTNINMERQILKDNEKELHQFKVRFAFVGNHIAAYGNSDSIVKLFKFIVKMLNRPIGAEMTYGMDANVKAEIELGEQDLVAHDQSTNCRFEFMRYCRAIDSDSLGDRVSDREVKLMTTIIPVKARPVERHQSGELWHQYF